jgi:hypothetical protein
VPIIRYLHILKPLDEAHAKLYETIRSAPDETLRQKALAQFVNPNSTEDGGLSVVQQLPQGGYGVIRLEFPTIIGTRFEHGTMSRQRLRNLGGAIGQARRAGLPVKVRIIQSHTRLTMDRSGLYNPE